MAQSRRVERVAALIRREVSELLVNGIKDERVSLGMVSVTNVEVAGDLQHCKIYVSIYGEPGAQQQALQLTVAQFPAGVVALAIAGVAAAADHQQAGQPAAQLRARRHRADRCLPESRPAPAAGPPVC